MNKAINRYFRSPKFILDQDKSGRLLAQRTTILEVLEFYFQKVPFPNTFGQFLPLVLSALLSSLHLFAVFQLVSVSLLHLHFSFPPG